MSIASCLLLYSLAVTVLALRPLARLTRAGIAPRLGVAVWLAAIGSVVASWTTTAIFLVTEFVRDWAQPGGTVVSACFTTLGAVATGHAGPLLQVGLLALTILAGLALAVLAVRLGRSLVRARTSTHEHARMARLAGRRVAGLDAVVLDAPERVAYCVAGRPHAVVITSAALEALDEPHLHAVLAHERAHLAGRHHVALAFTRALASTLPAMTLFTLGAAEVARLLEMCADDTAARTHGSRTVLTALLALSGAAQIPADALGATGVGVLARAERLAAPSQPGQRWRARLLLSAVTVLVLTGPLVTGMLAAHGLALCGGSMTG